MKPAIPPSLCGIKFANQAVLKLNRYIPIGTDEPFSFAVAAKAPCEATVVLGFTTEYTNDISGAEHVQKLETSATLVFGDEPPQKN